MEEDVFKSLEKELRRIRINLDEPRVLAELEFEDSSALLSANSAALIHIAAQLVSLAGKSHSGSHFTIDEADILEEGPCSLTVALKRV